MCGKYYKIALLFQFFSGSPPHVREVLIFCFFNSALQRITPACAGSTKFYLSYIFSFLGSPPHVREVRMFLLYVYVLFRITPACAGSTNFNKKIYIIIQDHPRMCGKYQFEFKFNSDISGSPPHVREVPDNLQGINGMYGITPACAGSTV